MLCRLEPVSEIVIIGFTKEIYAFGLVSSSPRRLVAHGSLANLFVPRLCLWGSSCCSKKYLRVHYAAPKCLSTALARIQLNIDIVRRQTRVCGLTFLF
jgi:hypothetical protein